MHAYEMFYAHAVGTTCRQKSMICAVTVE